MELYQVDLDCTDPNSETLNSMLKQYSVTMEVIDECSPSGHPEVRLKGKKSDLRVIILLEFDDKYLYKYIEKVKQ